MTKSAITLETDRATLSAAQKAWQTRLARRAGDCRFETVKAVALSPADAARKAWETRRANAPRQPAESELADAIAAIAEPFNAYIDQDGFDVVSDAA